jgi:hypothetical protein
MNCPICKTKVTNNADYSQHMNKVHRGIAYSSIKDIPVLDNKFNQVNKDKDSYKAKSKGNHGFKQE